MIEGYVLLCFPVKSNDMMLVIYVASLIRSILALHKLIDNKEQRSWTEKEASKPKV
jgi:26S proteasome regulatory subunit N8